MSDLKDELDKYATKSNKKRYIVIALILIIVLVLILIKIFSSQSDSLKVEYVTKKVEKGDLSVVVSATGNLNPTNSVEIGIEVSGTIKEIFVDYNDEVKVGQVLAVLDTVKLQSQVDSSKAALAISKANYKESEVNLRNKKLTYERVLKMFEDSNGKYPSKNELDDAKFAYEAAQSSLEASKARVMQAEFNLKTDEQNLEKAYVRSSIDGIVLNRDVEIGQTLAATMSAPKLFTLAKDLRSMDLIVSIDEADVADIKKDLPVTFTVDAYVNRTFKGKIKQVRLNPINSNGVITYETVVEVHNEDLLLKPGMTATARIVTKDSKDKILVPNSALRFKPKIDEAKRVAMMGPNRRPQGAVTKDLGKKELSPIYKLENGELKRVMVKILDTDGRSSAIESKELNIGDEVIISQKSINGK
ncbi:efflux RND transporter periplasmic adaptor subunit [Aliarcobacter skirrowii]|uniref:Efflux RND transporter periplasmic adaptor subunit n=1 Tax=Aliarcobacter skirrowii CCUG 10374 TaxID=1032239 RepID=A0AAD0SLT0_9BACT|nr:efflux RND transporter periplasmic adaptor subunit [Aliarcobacter skirrowii]AXX85147.1 RND family efflux system, membrane fusion protein [Aliarcobacter skirrowii CCUG 10374]KAB0620696.1 efflux RND transporter periplasmic adaptor subunit [Aliarcobacter skirrowii CCUG 10374]RXI25957.1 efflux RND transporter periplasmic adaptor subunit [Aliarcobacter skirrowii CCUG 10374]SUU96327.1 Macrolide-specific efflux protein macA precursor [Aliarcobacter skirrowii]HAC71611.1 efflux RND transporter perip